jgi:hypothetical protein
VRLAEPAAHGASEWVHVVLLAGGTLALIAVVLGQWVGTLLTIFVTNNFKVGISLLSREACWTAGKASDDVEENRARTQRNLLFSLWVLGTDTALLASMFLPAVYVFFYEADGSATAAQGGFPLSIADAVTYAWRTGHLRGIGESISAAGWGNKPLAVMGAICIEGIPVVVAASVTAVWFFGESLSDERRWRWSCYIMELSGCSCLGMWQLALAAACFVSDGAIPGVTSHQNSSKNSSEGKCALTTHCSMIVAFKSCLRHGCWHVLLPLLTSSQQQIFDCRGWNPCPDCTWALQQQDHFGFCRIVSWEKTVASLGSAGTQTSQDTTLQRHAPRLRPPACRWASSGRSSSPMVKVLNPACLDIPGHVPKCSHQRRGTAGSGSPAMGVSAPQPARYDGVGTAQR